MLISPILDFVCVYYAGYESAVDENTRLFTKDQMGPLIWNPQTLKFTEQSSA